MGNLFKTWYGYYKALRAEPDRARANFSIDLFWDICFSVVIRIGIPRAFRFVDWLVALSEGSGDASIDHAFIVRIATWLAILFFIVSAVSTVSKLLIANWKSIVNLWRKKN